MSILKAFKESLKNLQDLYFWLRPSKNCWDNLFVVDDNEDGKRFGPCFELYRPSIIIID